MNWKKIVGFVVLVGGLTGVSFIVDKHSEGTGTAPFNPFMLIVSALFTCLGFYLSDKERQKKAGN